MNSQCSYLHGKTPNASHRMETLRLTLSTKATCLPNARTIEIPELKYHRQLRNQINYIH